MQPPPPIAFPQPDVVKVGTLYAQDGPLVQIELPRRVIRVAPDEAVSIAQKMVAEATSARLDGFLIDWLHNAGFEPPQIGALIAAFREYRAQAAGDDNNGSGGA
jgi:hypothetical protein